MRFEAISGSTRSTSEDVGVVCAEGRDGRGPPVEEVGRDVTEATAVLAACGAPWT